MHVYHEINTFYIFSHGNDLTEAKVGIQTTETFIYIHAGTPK